MDFMLKHDKVIKDGIGILGISKGSDIVGYLSTVCPQVLLTVDNNRAFISDFLYQIKAAVRISGAPYWNVGVVRHRGVEFPAQE
jgi:hypothetical protein